MVSVAYGQGRVQRGRVRSICIFSSALFKSAFDIYNFSVILSLFDNN